MQGNTPPAFAQATYDGNVGSGNTRPFGAGLMQGCKPNSRSQFWTTRQSPALALPQFCQVGWAILGSTVNSGPSVSRATGRQWP